MKTLINSSLEPHQYPSRKRALILIQFFLIIFVYHILKDLKDTLVITGSDSGAQMIPFIKTWIILPFAILVSYVFSKLYSKYGRENTFYILVVSLLGLYALFAFILYPNSELLYLSRTASCLKTILPRGANGFIDMIGFWFYSLFYLSAELWSIMVLSVLFWGHINEITSYEESKEFYPKCFITGNIAGIVSGLTSSQLCKLLAHLGSWTITLQCMVVLVSICGMIIMWINRKLALYHCQREAKIKKSIPQISFKESCWMLLRSPVLCCIALLVVGFALNSNLLEVTMKDSIKTVYSLPHEYNAYVNQLTSIIGLLAVTVSLSSRWIFKRFNWVTIALVTPTILFLLSLIYFSCHLLPEKLLSALSLSMNLTVHHFIFIIGSVYYVVATSAKYTIFDMTKEIAFLSIPSETRMRGKLIIDSIGSRLGKTGASLLYQVLLITMGTSTGYISIIAIVSIGFIGLSIIATKKLGKQLSNINGGSL